MSSSRLCSPGSSHRFEGATPGEVPVLRFMAGGVRRIDKASYAETLSLYAGQGVGAIDHIAPAADIVAEFSRQLQAAAAA